MECGSRYHLFHKFQCTKTGFERCAMQITIAIKVPYHQLGRIRSFDYVASGSICKTFSEFMTLNNMNKEEKSQNAVDTKQNTYGMKLNNKREKTRYEFIFRNKKFQCTKTGFERCAMQITIAIKVPYHQLGRTRSFDYVASGSVVKCSLNMNKEEKS
ncbi:hypothetical protein T08_2557 [Trichinella sp. T8]|nr:hypothetical protein T08_2557 [Trichinella sp. T8]